MITKPVSVKTKCCSPNNVGQSPLNQRTILSIHKYKNKTN